MKIKKKIGGGGGGGGGSGQFQGGVGSIDLWRKWCLHCILVFFYLILAGYENMH